LPYLLFTLEKKYQMCGISFDVLCRVMDSIEECSKCADSAVCSASVACIVAMLGSLEELCTGKGITHTYMDRINAMYTQLDQCDYQGAALIFLSFSWFV
jgi:hypothetical protein